MSTEPQAAANDGLPPIPDVPVQEGARWRFRRPSSTEVAAWFETVPLDEGLEHKDFIGGVVLIPQTEKVKHTLASGGTRERQEQVFTPYVQIGSRVFYARRLAEKRTLRYRPRPLAVPKVEDRQSSYFNGNMPPGLWWHVVMDTSGNLVKYLCATWTIQLVDDNDTVFLEGQGTKQVTGLSYNGLDDNAVMKAETGAVGRALGVAGILTVGTGIATADDMQEFVSASTQAPTATLALPPTEVPNGELPDVSEADKLPQLRARLLALQAQVQELGAWSQFLSWYNARKEAEGWGKLDEIPIEGMAAIIAGLEKVKAEAEAAAAIG